jgi:hypothetical protein
MERRGKKHQEYTRANRICDWLPLALAVKLSTEDKHLPDA